MAQAQSSISDVLLTKFSNSVFELAQQTQARTRPICDVVQLDAEMMMFPRIGNVEAQVLNTRYPEIIPADIQWDNRRLATQRVGVPFYVDKWDAERMLADPKSQLAVRAAQALERNWDRTVIGALNASVLTGRTGATSVSAATDGVVTVNAQAGFTYDTLLIIEENFQSVEIGLDPNVQKWLFISEQEHAKLMREGTLINGDYSRQYAVDQGRLKRVLDFNVIVFGSATPNPMLQVSGGVRNCFAVASNAIKVGVTQNWEIEVDRRNDRWHTTQILASGIFGAVRMEGARVQVIQTTPGQ